MRIWGCVDFLCLHLLEQEGLTAVGSSARSVLALRFLGPRRDPNRFSDRVKPGLKYLA
jgi:hypothetical protein